VWKEREGYRQSSALTTQWELSLTCFFVSEREREKELIRLMHQLNRQVMAESPVVLPTTEGDYASKTKNGKKRRKEHVRRKMMGKERINIVEWSLWAIKSPVSMSTHQTRLEDPWHVCPRLICALATVVIVNYVQLTGNYHHFKRHHHSVWSNAVLVIS